MARLRPHPEDHIHLRITNLLEHTILRFTRDGPRGAPGRPQEGAQKGNPNEHFELSVPRGPQEALRGPQEASQEAPRGPQEHQEGPKRPPRSPREAPKRPLNCPAEAPESPLERPQEASMRTPTQNPSTVAGWVEGHLIAGIRAASRLSMLRTTSTNSQGAASDAPPASSIRRAL